MKKIYLLLILCSSLSCYNGLGDMYDDLGMKVPICVNLSAAASGDGRGWGKAYKTIQEAVDAANSGDEIWVANPSGIDSLNVIINKSVTLYGGFNGTESKRDERNLSNKTVIKGINGTNAIQITANGVVVDGFELNNFNNSNGILINTPGCSASIYNTDFISIINTTRAAILLNRAGIEISKCSFVSNIASSGNGGAIKSTNNDTDNITITIKDSIFKKNTASTSGGACYFQYVDNLKILGCTFGVDGSLADANTAGSGGALFVENTNTIISDSFFYNNSSTTLNGGSIVNASTTTGNMQINNCSFSDNSSNVNGGAIYSSGDITISNSNITDNTAQYGGGICLDGASKTFSISNSSIAYNHSTLSTGGGGGIGVFNGDCIITGSTISNNDAVNNGGGVYVNPGTSTAAFLSVTNSRFISNTVQNTNGGAISFHPYNNSKPLIIKSCRFENNTAPHATNGVGGAVWLNSSASGSFIVNSHFYNNSSGSLGGALYLINSQNPALTNLTFCSNQTSTNGGAIYGASFSYTINNSVFYNNIHSGPAADNVAISSGTFTLNNSFANGGFYSGGSPMVPGGAGSITNDSSNPFISTVSTSASFLYPAAVIVDRGDGTAPGLSLVSTDLAGNPRKNGIVDIGAYERQ